MKDQIQKHNGKGIVYLDRHPIVAKARRRFETARKEYLFLWDQRSFYWEIGNYFTRFFRSDRTYRDIWHNYPSGECRDIRYTNLPSCSPYFPVLGISEGDFASYALFLLNPAPFLDKNSKTMDNLSDGIAILNSDFRIRGVSCLFTSDLYDKVSDTLGIDIKVPPILASQPQEALQKYEQSLRGAKQELGNICTELGITTPVRHKAEAPKISRDILKRIAYKGSFGVWLP